MVKIGVGKVKDGDILSEKLRELIDKLHYHYVVYDKSQISIYKPNFLTRTPESPDNSLCPMEIEEVKRTISGCQACHDRTPDVWKNCSAR